MNQFLNQLAGYKRVKQEFIELLDMFHHQEKYEEQGAKLPSGILVYGEPGVGKTAMIRALLNASKRKTFEIVLDDVSAENAMNTSMKSTFDQAKKNGKSIVFIDDLDLILPEKDYGREHTNIELKYLLKEIDDSTHHDVIVIAAVNDIISLDDALVRSGRFDRKIKVDLPEDEDRKAIIHHYLNKTSITIDDSLISQMIKSTSRKSGSDIKLIINEMIVKAVVENAKHFSRDIYEYAFDRLNFSDVNKGYSVDDIHLERISYHEIGHAVMSLALNPQDFDKVSLSKQSTSSGHIRILEQDMMVKLKSDIEKRIMISLAGFLTEEMIYNDPSTLATDDLRKVKQLADYYIKVCGFSEIAYVEYKDSPFESFDSDQRKIDIENEVKLLINELIAKANKILFTNLDRIHKYSNLLIERGTLYLEDFDLNHIVKADI